MRTFPLKLAGTNLGTRMTVIRLEDGSLWLHSVGSIDEVDVELIKAQGKLAYLVAPNMWHHTYLKRAKKFFPEAKIYAPPGLAQKRSDIGFDSLLTPKNVYPWSEEIKSFHIAGMPKVEETVFFHPRSQSLIVGDLVFNLQRDMNLWEQTLFRLLGTYKRFAVSRLFLSKIKDKKLFKDSLREVLELPIKRIIPTHGEIVEDHASQHLNAVFRALWQKWKV